jgi:TolB protein
MPPVCGKARRPEGSEMKTSAVCFFFCVVLATLAAGPARKIAFVRGDNIWVANIDGTGAKKVTVGSSPNLSPDGRRIAFDSAPASAYERAAKGSEPETHIAVVDLGSGKITVAKDIPTGKASGPVWSPDGKQIAFVLEKPDAFFDLDLIGADGTGFKTLKKGETQTEQTYAAPCWARDGQSIFCHDTKNIYRVALDGAVIAQWEIAKLIPVEYLTSGARIDVSPDAGRLLITVDYRRNDEAPPPSLWSFDLNTQTTIRLTTPRELWVGGGCWLDNDNILFETEPPDGAGRAIYRISIDGKDVKRLIKNAHEVSVSAP